MLWRETSLFPSEENAIYLPRVPGSALSFWLQRQHTCSPDDPYIPEQSAPCEAAIWEPRSAQWRLSELLYLYCEALSSNMVSFYFPSIKKLMPIPIPIPYLSVVLNYNCQERDIKHSSEIWWVLDHPNKVNIAIKGVK